tara:strand:+ start:147 stop:431 length:285 start_codon:yes stop_codon:yes gene_type:complete
MNFQEGTVVTTQINHPPITLSGVVIASKKIDAEEDRTFEVFKVMFQNESKNVGTYVWCSESMNYNAPDNNSPQADLVYESEAHAKYCPLNVTKA